LFQVSLSIGIVSTLMFYWLVRQKDRTSIEDEDDDVARIENSENDRQVENGRLIENHRHVSVIESSENDRHVENGRHVARIESYENDRQVENGVVVGQNSSSSSAEKRRKSSKDKDRNTREEGPSNSEDLFDSPNSLRRKSVEHSSIRTSEHSELKKTMTIRRWFKQPQLYQVLIFNYFPQKFFSLIPYLIRCFAIIDTNISGLFCRI
jgi:hypothetical protein